MPTARDTTTRAGARAPRRIRVARPVVALAAAALAAGLLPTITATPVAGADAGAEAQFVSATNGVRASVGAPPLGVDGVLTAKARGWAQYMADGGCGAATICHSNLPDGVSEPWQRLGENVGVGASVDQIQGALVASPGHYRNMTDPGFTRIGVGVAYGGGRMFVSEVFLESPGGAPVGADSAPGAVPSPASGPGTPPRSGRSSSTPRSGSSSASAPSSAPPVPSVSADELLAMARAQQTAAALVRLERLIHVALCQHAEPACAQPRSG